MRVGEDIPLDAHVVHGGADGPATDGVGVARDPADLDGVGVGAAEEEGHDEPGGPLGDCRGVGEAEPEKEREGPELGEDGGQGHLVEELAEVCEEEHVED